MTQHENWMSIESFSFLVESPYKLYSWLTYLLASAENRKEKKTQFLPRHLYMTSTARIVLLLIRVGRLFGRGWEAYSDADGTVTTFKKSRGRDDVWWQVMKWWKESGRWLFRTKTPARSCLFADVYNWWILIHKIINKRWKFFSAREWAPSDKNNCIRDEHVFQGHHRYVHFDFWNPRMHP